MANRRVVPRTRRGPGKGDNEDGTIREDDGHETSSSGVGMPLGVSMQDSGYGDRLEIKKLETSKDLIEQPELAENELKLIPSRGHSVIINGASGSGKSTLLANYAKNPNFFGPSPERPKGWFDKIFLFSPTADGDDVQRSLGIPKSNVCTDMDEAPEWIEAIFKAQKTKLAGGGKAHKAPQYWFIFDDVIGETKLMNDKQFLMCWYMIRHNNGTTTACTQHYKKLPKVCRQQASFIHFFAGNQAEVEQIVDDFAPPLYTKREFRDMVTAATIEPFSFLTVCMKVSWPYRFRLNLGTILVLDRLLGHAGVAKRGQSNHQTEAGSPDDKSNDVTHCRFSVTSNKKTKTAPRQTFRSNEVREAVDAIVKHYIQSNDRKNEQKATRLD